MFCTSCGSQVADHQSFCPKCGAVMKSQSTGVQGNPASAAPHMQPQGQTPYAAQTPYNNQTPYGSQSGYAAGTPYGNGQQPPVAAKSGTNFVPFLIAGLLIGVLLAGGIFASTRFGTPSQDKKKQEIVEKPIKETEPVEETVIVTSGETTRTLMIYMVGSDLESRDGKYGGAASKDIREILAADLPENVNIVLECGGSEVWQNANIPDGEVTRFLVRNGKLQELERLGRTSMSHEGDLTDFINYAANNYPASNYSLILWDHGGGIPVGFGYDELADYDAMYDYQIGRELENSGIHFDAVIFDACNMCTLEMGRALQPSADYMVGAESYVNNAGIYYTNWLSKLDGNAREFCEVIVQDYMDSIQAEGLVGSMSVIRLDFIDEVYDAYIDYVGSVKSNLDDGDYAAYYQARGNCGYYEENDSVDLITLATSYNTGSSTPLINAVVNSVVYTESDIAYGHGLMAYSPYEWYEEYTTGRTSFENLDYDPVVTDFYDNFVSMELAYLGEDYVDWYAGDWYIADYETEAEDIAEVSSSTVLDVVETDYYYAVELTDEDWDIISSIEQYVVIEFDDSYLLLGSDYTSTVDSANRLALVDPDAWVYVGDSIATYYCASIYDDPNSDSWSQTGMIPVTVNGEDAYLLIYYDENNPTGKIQGYSFYDFETGEEDDATYFLEDTDIVDLVYQYLDSDGNITYEAVGSPVPASELILAYATIDLNDYTTYGYYLITDVYGNTYETDILPFGRNDSVD